MQDGHRINLAHAAHVRVVVLVYTLSHMVVVLVESSILYLIWW
jgi:hypothetical protein